MSYTCPLNFLPSLNHIPPSCRPVKQNHWASARVGLISICITQWWSKTHIPQPTKWKYQNWHQPQQLLCLVFICLVHIWQLPDTHHAGTYTLPQVREWVPFTLFIFYFVSWPVLNPLARFLFFPHPDLTCPAPLSASVLRRLAFFLLPIWSLPLLLCPLQWCHTHLISLEVSKTAADISGMWPSLALSHCTPLPQHKDAMTNIWDTLSALARPSLHAHWYVPLTLGGFFFADQPPLLFCPCPLLKMNTWPWTDVSISKGTKKLNDFLDCTKVRAVHRRFFPWANVLIGVSYNVFAWVQDRYIW